MFHDIGDGIVDGGIHSEIGISYSSPFPTSQKHYTCSSMWFDCALGILNCSINEAVIGI